MHPKIAIFSFFLFAHAFSFFFFLTGIKLFLFFLWKCIQHGEWVRFGVLLRSTLCKSLSPLFYNLLKFTDQYPSAKFPNWILLYQDTFMMINSIHVHNACSLVHRFPFTCLVLYLHCFTLFISMYMNFTRINPDSVGYPLF